MLSQKGKLSVRTVLIQFSALVSLDKSTEDVIITLPHLSHYRG